MYITATLDYDYGCVNIKVGLAASDNSPEELFLFRYTNSESNTADLIAILHPEQYEQYRDILVEQGERYKYGVSQSLVSAVFNPASVSNAITQSWVYVDFEDIFLSDRDCSLRIKFNPQVSSFKNIIQEQKIETIGNRFPFFFRNGQLQYREIPISGLISTEMDEYFAAALSAQDTSLRSATDAGAISGKTQREIYYNERKYREKVEAWLNNCQPKVFRSPTEGNYILRLMGVSMTPNQQLSRRLHTFNATGYEVAEYNVLSLINYHMLPVDHWYRIGDIASLGVWGKVKSSNLVNSAKRVGAEDKQLEINNVDITKIVGGKDIAVGGYIAKTTAKFMAPRASGNDIANATTAGLVIASDEVNRLNTTEEGLVYVNSISLDNIELQTGKIFQIGPNEERVERENADVPEEIDTNVDTVLSSTQKNRISIDNSGYMNINKVTSNKLIQEDLKELYIGGGGL